MARDGHINKLVVCLVIVILFSMLLTTGVSAKIFDFKKLGIDLLGKDDYDKDINLNKDISLDKDIKNSKLAKNEYKELEEEDKAKKSAKEKAKAEAEKKEKEKEKNKEKAAKKTAKTTAKLKKELENNSDLPKIILTR